MTLNTQARSLFLPLFAAAALTACSDTAAPTEKFTGPTGFTLINVSNPIDITPDGETAVFEDLLGSPNGNLYLYSLSTGALTLKTQAGSPFVDFATGVSEDLRVSAIYGEPAQAGIWSEATGWTVIPGSFAAGCDVLLGGAWDISADGRVAVGFDWDGCNTVGMRWTEVGGTWTGTQFEQLGFPNRPTVVSGNGLVAAGSAATEDPFVDRRPAVWQADGSGSFIAGGFTDDSPGEVLAINFDGSMMAGTWVGDGFYWTQATGTVDIGQLEASTDAAFSQTYCNAIAANDQLIFGASGPWGASKAFVWTAAAGMRSLQDIATAEGIAIPHGVVLNSVRAASADGTIVIGQATDAQFKSYSFVLKLPVSAYGL